MKRLKHIIEALAVYLIYGILCLLPIRISSAIMGCAMEKVGGLLKANTVALNNLKKCFSKLSEEERGVIARRMWNNLGRIIGEFPHWHRMSSTEFNELVEFDGIQVSGLKKALLLSGHFGNWELAPRISNEKNFEMCMIHRPANNPHVDKFINNIRKKSGTSMLSKGLSGIREIIKLLRDGKVIGMLVDQKYNTGADIPLFGMPAKTVTAPANIALKYDIPIIMVSMVRVRGVHYRVTFHEPINIQKGDTAEIIMTKINKNLESWIREHPEQWFWVHRRWGKDV